MKTINEEFSVNFKYPVIFTEDMWSVENTALLDCLKSDANIEPIYRVLIFLDRGLSVANPELKGKIENWFANHSDSAVLVESPVVIPGGEFIKNRLSMILKMINTAQRCQLGRKDTIIAIGGGCVQDVVGFAASMVHRGCRFIRVNSTTLSQADAGVGVKNGMDVGSNKNFIGTFYPPFAVINDSQLLTTLSDSDWVAGVAEAIKVAIIKDKTFLKFIEQNTEAIKNRNLQIMAKIIERTAELHLNHIATGDDAFENGSARPLDFGHWAAHRLEMLSCFQISHGHAVAIGIAVDCVYAKLNNFISEDELQTILAIISSCGLPIFCDELRLRGTAGNLEILEGLAQFQAHLGGKLCVTLPRGIGEREEVHQMNPILLEMAIKYLCEMQK